MSIWVPYPPNHWQSSKSWAAQFCFPFPSQTAKNQQSEQVERGLITVKDSNSRKLGGRRQKYRRSHCSHWIRWGCQGKSQTWDTRGEVVALRIAWTLGGWSYNFESLSKKAAAIKLSEGRQWCYEVLLLSIWWWWFDVSAGGWGGSQKQ